ncbi:hypothetical protein CDAR_540271 [Caerostris darwini]|uniref:Uncharacterized protein n=1 Tax=Caerostris darwini TaxID=1538125 RepID=A0AAV4WRJ4_9ARAC|nr:hypothetical protein CDAR_540271 [Caerostris darwini]
MTSGGVCLTFHCTPGTIFQKRAVCLDTTSLQTTASGRWRGGGSIFKPKCLHMRHRKPPPGFQQKADFGNEASKPQKANSALNNATKK